LLVKLRRRRRDIYVLLIFVAFVLVARRVLFSENDPERVLAPGSFWDKVSIHFFSLLRFLILTFGLLLIEAHPVCWDTFIEISGVLDRRGFCYSGLQQRTRRE
jgi:hypothetical protein